MHIVYLDLTSDKNSHDPESFYKSSNLPHPFFVELSKNLGESISIFQRAPFNARNNLNKVDYHFIKDEFEPILRWWQEPVKVIEKISALKPDIILVRGLNLPLQFRWLRREVGKKTEIIGEHTGETIWANRNLWLQQFGLRVVNGFLFKTIKDSLEWTKASVILETQPIAELFLSSKNPKAAANSFQKFYIELLSTK